METAGAGSRWTDGQWITTGGSFAVAVGDWSNQSLVHVSVASHKIVNKPPIWCKTKNVHLIIVQLQEQSLMNEDVFNLQIRKFLKKVGIQSQREIEMAVRRAIESGQLTGSEKLNARVQLTVSKIDVDHTIEGTITLE